MWTIALRQSLWLLRVFTMLILPAASSTPIWASTVRYRTDAELVTASERIVHARVLSVRGTYGPDGRSIYTVTTAAVLEDFTGIRDETIEMWELGGVVDDRFMYVGGQVRHQPGD